MYYDDNFRAGTSSRTNFALLMKGGIKMPETITEIVYSRFRPTLYPLIEWAHKNGLTTSVEKLRHHKVQNHKSYHFRLSISGFDNYQDSRMTEIDNVKGFTWARENENNALFATEEETIKDESKKLQKKAF